MQQTETLKLNLIETEDLISPLPLNENAEKLEGAIRTKTAETRTDRLEQRILTLESKPIIVGTYVGDDKSFGYPQFIPLSFTPSLVLVQTGEYGLGVAWPGRPWRGAVNVDVLTVMEGGFQVMSGSNCTLNTKGVKFVYVAFA